jgi:hypothetical protein
MPTQRRKWLEREAPCARCGTNAWRYYPHLKTKWSCVACVRAASRDQQRKVKQADPVTYLWRIAKARAAVTGTPFTVTAEEVAAVWPADWCCPALGTAFPDDGRRDVPTAPTLTRLDPRRGYAVGNIVVCSRAAAAAITSLLPSELRRVAAWYAECFPGPEATS